MKTFKDLFLDPAADVHGTSRRIIKASLKMATVENGSPTGQAQASSNEDDLSKSDQKPTDQ